jgi:hypothetical protein
VDASRGKSYACYWGGAPPNAVSRRREALLSRVALGTSHVFDGHSHMAFGLSQGLLEDWRHRSLSLLIGCFPGLAFCSGLRMPSGASCNCATSAALPDAGNLVTMEGVYETQRRVLARCKEEGVVSVGRLHRSGECLQHTSTVRSQSCYRHGQSRTF